MSATVAVCLGEGGSVEIDEIPLPCVCGRHTQGALTVVNECKLVDSEWKTCCTKTC